MGRIAAVIRRDDHQIPFMHRCNEFRQPRVEIRKRICVAFHIVAVAVKHVKIHKVREYECALAVLQIFQRCLNTIMVVLGVIHDANVPVAEDILDLPDRDVLQTALCEAIQNGFRDRLNRIVPSVFRPRIHAVSAEERPCNDAPYKVIPHEHSTRGFTHAVKLRKRDHLFMRRDLEHTVCGGVYDRLTGAHMLIPKFLNDCRSGSDAVAKCSTADLSFEFIDQFFGETVRIRFERRIHDDARHLPMPAGRVLCERFLSGSAECSLGAFGFRQT